MASKMSEKIRLDSRIGFENTFYTKSINDSIGPSIILRSIYITGFVCLVCRARRGFSLDVGHALHS